MRILNSFGIVIFFFVLSNPLAWMCQYTSKSVVLVKKYGNDSAKVYSPGTICFSAVTGCEDSTRIIRRSELLNVIIRKFESHKYVFIARINSLRDSFFYDSSGYQDGSEEIMHVGITLNLKEQLERKEFPAIGGGCSPSIYPSWCTSYKPFLGKEFMNFSNHIGDTIHLSLDARTPCSKEFGYIIENDSITSDNYPGLKVSLEEFLRKTQDLTSIRSQQETMINESFGIHILPNKMIYINFPVSPRYGIKVFDLHGRQVFKLKPNKMKLNLMDISFLGKGIYFLKTKALGVDYSKKIMLIH